MDKSERAHAAALAIAPDGGYVVIDHNKVSIYLPDGWQLREKQHSLDEAMEACRKWGDTALGIALVANGDHLILDEDPIDLSKLNGTEELLTKFRAKINQGFLSNEGTLSERSNSGN